jgi:pyruvate formate lyase activating enzyme
MKIVGLEKNSLVDYPGKIAAVVFTPGCNLDCYYCHNRVLLGKQGCQNLISKVELFEFLKKRKGLLDGVVVSGGEPTLQKGLREFMSSLKNLGFSVKLDTNGSNPEQVQDLIEHALVDYVAMDIKAPFSKYRQICGQDSLFGTDEIFLDKVKESIRLLLSGKVAYEFRTTFIPELTQDDIIEVAKAISGAQLYVLQQYRLPPELPADEKRARRLLKQSHSADYILQTVGKIVGLVEECQTRGI